MVTSQSIPAFLRGAQFLISKASHGATSVNAINGPKVRAISKIEIAGGMNPPRIKPVSKIEIAGGMNPPRVNRA